MEDANVEQTFAIRETAMKLRRIADAIEAGKSFRIQINGNRVLVPAGARIDIELQHEEYDGEVEVDISWKRTKNWN
jgi:amphi-Trp domain-containing protein